MAGPQWQRSVLCLFVPALLAPTAAPVDAQEVGLRDRIEQEFSVDAMVDGNLAVYRELLGGG